ncbi:MAG: hypothetical protein J0L92_29360 [Deltaproteobacteria bacterium]|nr:hypothetical protein [Deltaproteobacteria bacterium]
MPAKLTVAKEPITISVLSETADRLRLAAAVARGETGKRLTMGEIVDALVRDGLPDQSSKSPPKRVPPKR